MCIRDRYNSSLLDANLTDAGDDYDALKETYVIFITENDVLKAGLPIYHVDRTVRETGTVDVYKRQHLYSSLLICFRISSRRLS